MSMEKHDVEKLDQKEVRDLFGELLERYPILADDGYSLEVFRSGIGNNGQQILDFEDFAKKRAEFLESQKEEVQFAASGKKLPQNVSVIHSPRPDLEEK